MTISKALAQTILAYVKDGVGENESIDKVFTFMDKHGLVGFKPAVARHLERMLNAQRESTVVRLYSPFPLPKEEKDKIRSQFAADCNLEEIIDEDLVGGFRTEHDYRYVDATTADAITRLKQHLLHP
jgi:F0F1-type ATP synthase delta subunit